MVGVNTVAAYAAQTGNMPKVFGKMNPKTGMPDGAAITNGVVASLLLRPACAREGDFGRNLLDAVQPLR